MVKVLYWNLCSEVDPNTSLHDTQELIDSEQIDIACLQEVPYVTQATEDRTTHIPLSQLLADDLGMDQMFTHTRTICRTDEKIRGYGTAILSRTPFIEKRTAVIRDDRFAYMTASPENRRVMLSVRVEGNPDTMVSTAHLSYALPLGLGRNGQEHEQQSVASILKDQMKYFEVAFGGDINAAPEKTMDALLEELGLNSVLDNSMPTFRSRHWFAGHAKRNLDRVYMSRGLIGVGYVGDRKHSDHSPVIVEVSKRE